MVFCYDESSDQSISVIDSFLNGSTTHFAYRVVSNQFEKGPGFARSFGYSKTNSESKYVLFLDADDTFKDCFLEKLVAKAEETASDVVCCGYTRIDEISGGGLSTEMVNNPTSACDIYDPSLPLTLINPALWNKLYKRTALTNCSFSNIRAAEDLYFFLETLKNVRKIAFVNEPLYEYWVRVGSRGNTLTDGKFKEVRESFKRFSQRASDQNYSDLVASFLFLRIGIGMVVRVCRQGNVKCGKLVKTVRMYLKDNFNVFGKNPFLSYDYLKKGGNKGRAIWASKILYKLGSFSFVLRLYIAWSKRAGRDVGY